MSLVGCRNFHPPLPFFIHHRDGPATLWVGVHLRRTKFFP
nr:MAG TPA: hypothetical protein [Caudoviricetes sp.]